MVLDGMLFLSLSSNYHYQLVIFHGIRWLFYHNFWTFKQLSPMAVSYRHGIPRLETGWAKCVSDFRAQAEDVSLGFLGFRPGWCPSSESPWKVGANKSNVTMVYGWYIELVNGIITRSAFCLLPCYPLGKRLQFANWKMAQSKKLI